MLFVTSKDQNGKENYIELENLLWLFFVKNNFFFRKKNRITGKETIVSMTSF